MWNVYYNVKCSSLLFSVHRYYIDLDGALNLDPKVQRLLLLFACTNSSFNPLVYGVFNIRRRNQLPVAPMSSVIRSHVTIPGRPSPPRSSSARIMALRDDARLPTMRRPTVWQCASPDDCEFELVNLRW